MAGRSTGRGSTSSLLELRENPSRWVWAAAAARVPPTAAALSRRGFRRGVWADGLPRDAPNLLLLLHGLGDAPDMYARFGAKLALPQTSALALAAPLPLPLGIEGGAWFESFEADGRLIEGADASDQRRPLSLARDARAPLLSVLRLLVRECGWSPERIFLFGYAHGGTVALDLLQHLDGLAGGGPCRLGGCVSWCGLPLPEAPPPPAGAVVRTPVLAVVGERDPLTPSARELLSRLTSGAAEVARSGGGGGGGAVASGAAASGAEGGGAAGSVAEGGGAAASVAEGSVAECTLEVLPGRGGGMVGSANEAALLMAFFGKHLSLNSALEDDPSVIRVS